VHRRCGSHPDRFNRRRVPDDGRELRSQFRLLWQRKAAATLLDRSERAERWLALDLNHNGKIDNGQELFGNATAQPGPAVQRLGFKALARYDTPEYGGNRDGVIDSKDYIYSRLLVWVDRNHNGVSDAGELMTLQQAGVTAISLDYQDAHYTDQYGNQFRYRAGVQFAGAEGKQNWAYDVVLLSPSLPAAPGGSGHE
jgi:hypothetical protein